MKHAFFLAPKAPSPLWRTSPHGHISRGFSKTCQSIAHHSHRDHTTQLCSAALKTGRYRLPPLGRMSNRHPKGAGKFHIHEYFTVPLPHPRPRSLLASQHLHISSKAWHVNEHIRKSICVVFLLLLALRKKQEPPAPNPPGHVTAEKQTRQPTVVL